MTDRVVIVGASIGGLTTAETLRQEGFDGEIVLVGDESHLPYTRPPLSKQILLGQWDARDAMIRTADELAALDIRVRTGCAATGLDVDARRLNTSNGPIGFDELVIATGTEARRHPALQDAATLRTMDDALVLRERLTAASRVAVVGSGILGSEIASAARKYGADTLLVGRSGTLSFGGAGRVLSDELIDLHAEHGVEVALRSGIVRASCWKATGGATLTFADGSERSFDLVVAMIGGTPRTQWLRDSGLDTADGVACDVRGVAAGGISAVGDVAAWFDPVVGHCRRVEHQSYAIEQAIAVATRLANGADSALPVPLFWSELHGTRVQAYGWFDPTHALEVMTDDPATRGRVFGSHDHTGRLRGAIGWNAAPREFRAARAAIAAPIAAPVTQP